MCDVILGIHPLKLQTCRGEYVDTHQLAFNAEGSMLAAASGNKVLLVKGKVAGRVKHLRG